MSDNVANSSPEVGEQEKSMEKESSPNIKSVSDVFDNPTVDTEAEARRKCETVDIDGVPIDEDDIKFHSSKISKKDAGDMFVNVEGTIKRAEIFYLGMENYLWSFNQMTRYNQAITTYSRELPPRY